MTISCPEKGEGAKKLVPLPNSLEELLNIAALKFECTATKILTKDGAEIDDIELIRDGDCLIIISGAETETSGDKMPSESDK